MSGFLPNRKARRGARAQRLFCIIKLEQGMMRLGIAPSAEVNLSRRSSGEFLIQDLLRQSVTKHSP